MKKYIITAIVFGLIVGGSIITSQVLKQNSIERQQAAELRIKRDALNYEKEQDDKREAEESMRKLQLTWCLNDAEANYSANWENACVNAGKPKTCTQVPRQAGQDVDDYRTTEKEICFKKYGK